MAEYIEREALLKFIQDGLNNPDKARAFGHDAVEIMAEVQCAPAADVVAVVRCKDCKHGEVDDPDNFPDLHYCHEGCGWNNADFYCKSGERRKSE